MPPRRKSARSSAFGRLAPMLGMSVAVLAGVAGGYVWRSYAPLPFPQGTPLAGDPVPRTPVDKEVRQIQRRLQEIDTLRERTAEDLAEVQIKTLLQSGN